jgi:hypothetical protein
MSSLRRGFKTWCENAARGYRRELGLTSLAPLDPKALAKSLNIRIWEPHEIPSLNKAALHHLTVREPHSWSAVTLQVDGRKLIITNGTHSPERQNNSIAHEISHLVLEHEPARAFVSAGGLMMLNHYNLAHEEEADCLAGALLVPREALLHILGNGDSHQAAAKYFGVTLDLLRMRINLTGVGKQLGNRRNIILARSQ